MIPAALMFAALSGCADRQPTGFASGDPAIADVARDVDVPFNRKFVAWSERYSSSPIQMQLFSLDARQERQFADYADERVVAFARANPGRLYINGDEPDQYCVAPLDYAIWYHDFVEGVRAADPTARFSPAGFAEPNYKCCPLPDDVPAQCWWDKHSIGYAQQFYNAYVQRYGMAPPVDEWRFHDFGLRFSRGDIDGWWGRINTLASWSVAHGANMVLGSWGFMGWRESPSEYQEHLKQAMRRLMEEPRINSTVYWSYQQWLGNPHYLAEGDESLTPVGQTFVNPLTDVPTGATVVESDNGRAKIKWSNTTSAWATEAEFWVQPAGTGSFVYKSTEQVVTSGTAETPLVGFNLGDVVKGRVRYFNPYGQSAWSSFSEPLAIRTGQVRTWGTGALPCFMSKRISGQSCA